MASRHPHRQLQTDSSPPCHASSSAGSPDRSSNSLTSVTDHSPQARPPTPTASLPTGGFQTPQLPHSVHPDSRRDLGQYYFLPSAPPPYPFPTHIPQLYRTPPAAAYPHSTLREYRAPLIILPSTSVVTPLHYPPRQPCPQRTRHPSLILPSRHSASTTSNAVPTTAAPERPSNSVVRALANNAFNRFDTNSGDYLDLQEFINALRYLQLPISYSRALELFRELDTLEHGRLSRDDFISLCESQMPASHRPLEDHARDHT